MLKLKVKCSRFQSLYLCPFDLKTIISWLDLYIAPENEGWYLQVFHLVALAGDVSVEGLSIKALLTCLQP